MSADFTKVIEIFGKEEGYCCCLMSGTLSDIHMSEDAEEEDEEGVGEGEP